MKLINPKSKKGFVNLFADFIMQRLGLTKKTIIQVSLFNNFIVVNGKTDSDIILNILELKEEFFKKYETHLCETPVENTIGSLEIIDYNSDFFKNNCFRYNLELFNTKRPIYHKNILNFHQNEYFDSVEWRNGIFLEIPHNSLLPSHNFTFSPLQISSEFPYGYSLNVGRNLIYYAEYIAFNILNTISSESMKMLITNQKNIENDQIIEINSKSPYQEEKIESMILDIFDFDLEKFNKGFEDYDFCQDILNPSEMKPWLIKNIVSKDLHIFN